MSKPHSIDLIAPTTPPRHQVCMTTANRSLETRFIRDQLPFPVHTGHHSSVEGKSVSILPCLTTRTMMINFFAHSVHGDTTHILTRDISTFNHMRIDSAAKADHCQNSRNPPSENVQGCSVRSPALNIVSASKVCRARLFVFRHLQ